ncbi:zinc finger protein Xfin-like [Spodoptera litura]|uniref:Zinc finger protein Xfin-like n=1 Tax=Spodoptera litura TaxID=69820 RepID=A0A9J7IMJ3_SPOLT|nr:zinc finger protein Xfin-like [Spodoptera litura]
MLQQMSSPPSAQAGEVATVVRHLEGRVCGDVSSEEASDAADDFELPQCKIRRNYNCTKCTFFTQNPRAYLVHTRDAHFVRLKIYDCPYCIYASRHHQKLVRHVKMIHGVSKPTSSSTTTKAAAALSPPSYENMEQAERIEDLLEEVEDCEDMMMEVDEDSMDDNDVDGNRSVDQTAPSDGLKSKSKFFSCNKCNYVTHIRARFTKHVKYHSMPMIKCTMCDFRTPYKWNLDRHMKNHGGTGSFHCSMCNFTADIKQSLTVHEMNHHTPAAGQSLFSRRRNRVGASDTVTAELDAASALLPKEEEGSGDSRSSHSVSDMGLQYAERELVSCKSDSNDATASHDAITKKDNSNDGYSQLSPTHSTDEKQRQSRKVPRPIPQLIPLNSSTPNQKQPCFGEPPNKKFKESPHNDIDDVSSENSLLTGNPPTKETTGRKKNESFFDKLKERLLTETGEEGSLICKNCGFESKCLSEHSVHEKNCAPHANRVNANAPHKSLSSTRCQNCRHRCKSSADLYIHMQTCGKSANMDDENALKNQDSNDGIIPIHDKESEPHPMENIVFVWNNFNQNNPNKFEMPLDISINDDSTLPAELQRNYDAEIVDDNESMNLSPSQAIGRKVFKCPHCPFFSTTASRFHVHIVGHLNKKPFECSLCKYKSNWRWDITKHIKLKSARDPEHNEAKVLMTDETGRRNYSKYNKFLAMPVMNENGENEFHYLDPNTAVDSSMEIDEPFNDISDAMNVQFEMQPLNLQTQHTDEKYDFLENRALDDVKKPKKTLWKCKKCNYKDPSKEALLEHVRQHSRSDDEPKPMPKKLENNTPDPADLAYRCGHCNQLSNWKHVIQRHCRLKHDGVIKVITTVKPKPDPPMNINEINIDTCNKCPYRTSDKKLLIAHLQQHQPSASSIFKCYFCPFFVKDEPELIQHLLLHGITDPEDYIAKAMGTKSPAPEPQAPATQSMSHTKRHKCTECPYETNSKSQYMYHEQFHRLPADTPYKCPECNYSVSKRHLLHQHLRVHGIATKRMESEAELEASTSSQNKSDSKAEYHNTVVEIPYVWVSAKNEFHKMYKCRYCSYVNAIKCKIPNHEKIHCIVFENDTTIYKCLECKYTCDTSVRLSEHSKSHGEIYGRIYCPVEDDVPDEEQISKLRKVIELEKITNPETCSRDESPTENREIKFIYFCQKCPARFFEEGEIEAHEKDHGETHTFKCKSCDFSLSEEDDLTVHTIVHTDEYHTKTKMLKFIHNTHPSHRQPVLELVHCPKTSTITWIATGPSKLETGEIHMKKQSETKSTPRQYSCNQCPAKFFKNSALAYHMGLHGGEGEYKCKKCNYAVKNIGNLAKHELLHENENKTSCDYESGEDMDYKNIPLSGTDLFQRKTEAQKRVLTDKDKLVKPNDHFPPVLQADPQFGYLMHGNPEFIYPTYLKNGRQKEKRYKCHKCPSAFEKREQYKIHLSLHGSKQRYKCELCDYSVKYYANYVQHMRKHQMNDEAQAERKKGSDTFMESENQDVKQEDSSDNIKLAIKTMPKGAPKSDFQQFSISDQQTLRLLQRRRSMHNFGKDFNASDASPTKERKTHMCLLCPYANQRQDSLNNHYRRHDDSDVSNAGGHKCPHCDLAVVQSHFLREHLKTHFNYHKTLTPECFVANEDVSFTITKLDDDSKAVDLKIDIQNKCFVSNDEKIFVKIKTGELLVE